MSSIQATRLRKGMIIRTDQDLFRILDLQHVTPGNLRGSSGSRRATSGLARSPIRSSVRRTRSNAPRSTSARCSTSTATRPATTSWTPRAYEQVQLSAEALGDVVNYLIPEAVISVEFFESEASGWSCRKRST